MPLSGLSQSANTTAGGGIPASVDGTPLFIGYCSGGTPDTVYAFSDQATAKAVLVSGPLLESVCRVLPGLAYCVPVTSDVAAAVGTITKSGSGPTITASGTPTDNGTILVKIGTGGAVATATFAYSTDGGASYSQDTVTAATYLVPNTGVTVAFVTGTYVASEVYTIPFTAPGYSSTKLAAAFAAFQASTSSGECEYVHIVGAAADAAGAATMAVSLQSQLKAAWANNCYIPALIELPDLTPSALLTALTAVDAYLVSAVGGYVDIVSSVDQRVSKRPAAQAVTRRIASTKPHRHIGAVADGALAGVTKLYYDERATPAFAAGRVTSLRTRPPAPGAFVEDSLTLHGDKTHPLAKLHNVRVLCKALRICAAKLQVFVNGDWDSKPDGTLSDADADYIEGEVQTALEVGLGANCSRVVFALNRAEKSALSGKFKSTVAVQIKIYSPFIENEVAVVRTISTT